MDKTIALVISAVVLTMTAVVVIGMGSNSMGDLTQNSDDLQGRGCEFQQQRVSENPSLGVEDLSQKCRDGYRQQQQESQVIGSAIGIMGE